MLVFCSLHNHDINYFLFLLSMKVSLLSILETQGWHVSLGLHRFSASKSCPDGDCLLISVDHYNNFDDSLKHLYSKCQQTNAFFANVTPSYLF